jgi:hypothetical protein
MPIVTTFRGLEKLTADELKSLITVFAQSCDFYGKQGKEGFVALCEGVLVSLQAEAERRGHESKRKKELMRETDS